MMIRSEWQRIAAAGQMARVYNDGNVPVLIAEGPKPGFLPPRELKPRDRHDILGYLANDLYARSEHQGATLDVVTRNKPSPFMEG